MLILFYLISSPASLEILESSLYTGVIYIIMVQSISWTTSTIKGYIIIFLVINRYLQMISATYIHTLIIRTFIFVLKFVASQLAS